MRFSRFPCLTRQALFAYCASLTINAVHLPHVRAVAKMRHAGQLARAAGLDMVQAGWKPGAENFFTRLTKAQILAAVTEAKGIETANLLRDLKKKEMAQEAERLLAGSGWLPEPLRTPQPLDETTSEALPAFLEEDQLMAAE